jgi:tetratricopeptide (TPR) repeat protein
VPTARAAEPADDGTDYDELLRPGTDINQVSAVGKPKKFQRMLARELMWRAEESPNFLLAVSLAVRAVRIDPASLDARLFLSFIADGPLDEYIEELRRIVAIGEQDLGAEFFKENRGHFWQVMDTRPYMRARATLAQSLHGAGHTAAAMAEYEALLALNPGDNQGLRYPLLGCYLEKERLEDTQRLFETYGNEDSAMFTWGRVLERFLTCDLEGAIAALARARKANAHVEAYLTGKKKLPKSRPEAYTPHDISEAWICMDEIGGAWSRHREAMRWLKKNHATGNLFVAERQPRHAKLRPQ